MDWWSEICPPGRKPSVQFGGPTGISTLVVLVSWWCTALRLEPNNAQTDCLRTLKEIDRVFLEAINGIRNHPVAPASDAPPPSSQPCKRANTEEPLMQKRQRYE